MNFPVITHVDEFGPVWSDGVRRTEEAARALLDSYQQPQQHEDGCGCGQEHE